MLIRIILPVMEEMSILDTDCPEVFQIIIYLQCSIIMWSEYILVLVKEPIRLLLKRSNLF